MNEEHPDIGLGPCMTSADHGPAIGMIGVQHRDTHERRCVLLCMECHMAHAMATVLAEIGMGREVFGLVNTLFGRIGVTEDVAIEKVEAALEAHPIGEHVEPMRESLRQIRASQDKDITPIGVEDFARLMAATNVNAPKREEIN